MHYGDPLVRLCVLVNFNRRRLEKDGFLTAAAALLALAALPPVLAEAAAAALLALAALLPVLADAAAATILADVVLPPVRTAGWHVSVEGALRPYLGASAAGGHTELSSTSHSAQPEDAMPAYFTCLRTRT